MIKEDNTLKYNKDIGQYYLLPKAITDELPINDGDLKRAFGNTNDSVEKELKYLSQRVYNYMFSYNHPENHKWLKYKIYKNAKEERYFLKEAMKSFVFGAYESDMDRNSYVSDEKAYPKEVYMNLKNARLVGLSIYRGKIPDGDY